MKKCCLLFAVLLFPLLAMADYELDWPEEDIEEEKKISKKKTKYPKRRLKNQLQRKKLLN